MQTLNRGITERAAAVKYFGSIFKKFSGYKLWEAIKIDLESGHLPPPGVYGNG